LILFVRMLIESFLKIIYMFVKKYKAIYSNSCKNGRGETRVSFKD